MHVHFEISSYEHKLLFFAICFSCYENYLDPLCPINLFKCLINYCNLIFSALLCFPISISFLFLILFINFYILKSSFYALVLSSFTLFLSHHSSFSSSKKLLSAFLSYYLHLWSFNSISNIQFQLLFEIFFVISNFL